MTGKKYLKEKKKLKVHPHHVVVCGPENSQKSFILCFCRSNKSGEQYIHIIKAQQYLCLIFI